jgi:peptide/nickel transport system substrate-binding protein
VTLDPHLTNDHPSARVMVQIYETLIVQNEDLTLSPGLAASWEEIAHNTWGFRLREGVRFHNGEPFRAADVAFSLNRLRDPATAAPAAFLIDFIERVEAVDDHTVRITTAYPFAPLLAHLAHPATSILNEQAVVDAGDDYGTEVVVGTGPFAFERWDREVQLVLRRNDAWWGGAVAPERLVFRPIPEGSVRAIELEASGVDIAYQLELHDARRLEANPNIRLATVETLTTHYIGFNTRKALFDDVRVRQAINHAVDVEPIVEAVFTGQVVRATNPIAPWVFGADLGLEPYGYDVERARELLEEAGYGDGFNTTLWAPNSPLPL